MGAVPKLFSKGVFLKMRKCMIIGCGGVASVAIHKCCQNSEVFEGIMIASRTKSKCDAQKKASAYNKDSH